MFFGQGGHADVLEALADHPVKVRVVGSVFVALFFIGGLFFCVIERRGCAGKHIICQNEALIGIDGVAPCFDGFAAAAEL